ncbi:MAG: type-F conjugative transfer system secretin TraK [Syntrophaceae bacterium]
MKKTMIVLCFALLLFTHTVAAETTDKTDNKPPTAVSIEDWTSKKPASPPSGGNITDNHSAPVIGGKIAKKQPDKKSKSPVYNTASVPETNLEDLQDSLEKSDYKGILPDVPTAVQLSASDVNRVTCVNGAITDVIYSQEKGLYVKYSGKDAFVKFQVISMGDRKNLSYSATPTEIYFVCGDRVYSIIALPKRIPSQQVRLSNAVMNRIKHNKEFFADMPYEQRLTTIIQRTYKDEFEDSWTVAGVNKTIDAFRNYRVTHFRNVVIDGEGVILKEYHVRYTDKQYPEGGRLEEKMFLNKELTQNTIAIALDKTIVKPNELVRLFIVESKCEK